jgi:hypothetical protein
MSLSIEQDPTHTKSQPKATEFRIIILAAKGVNGRLSKRRPLYIGIVEVLTIGHINLVKNNEGRPRYVYMKSNFFGWKQRDGVVLCR